MKLSHSEDVIFVTIRTEAFRSVHKYTTSSNRDSRNPGNEFHFGRGERKGDNPFSLILQYGRRDEQGTKDEASNKGDGKSVFYSSPESLKRSKEVGMNGNMGEL